MLNTALLLTSSGTGTGNGGTLIMTIIMIVAFIAIFFFSTRSQKKQERESHSQPATGSDWTMCEMNLEANKNLPKHICTSQGLGLCMLSRDISMVVFP